MGWSGGGDIFDRVARALVGAGASDRIVTTVCEVLIDTLRDGDWDTLDESIDEFRSNRAVVAAFRLAAPDWLKEEDMEKAPLYPQPGSTIPDQPGYVVGRCGHRVAKSEWKAGFRVCERCPDIEEDEQE